SGRRRDPGRAPAARLPDADRRRGRGSRGGRPRGARRVSERPPDEILWNLLRGSLTTRALAVVSELGVADALAAGPRSTEELGRELGADPETLYRLLRALA